MCCQGGGVVGVESTGGRGCAQAPRTEESDPEREADTTTTSSEATDPSGSSSPRHGLADGRWVPELESRGVGGGSDPAYRPQWVYQGLIQREGGGWQSAACSGRRTVSPRVWVVQQGRGPISTPTAVPSSPSPAGPGGGRWPASRPVPQQLCHQFCMTPGVFLGALFRRNKTISAFNFSFKIVYNYCSPPKLVPTFWGMRIPPCRSFFTLEFEHHRTRRPRSILSWLPVPAMLTERQSLFWTTP